MTTSKRSAKSAKKAAPTEAPRELVTLTTRSPGDEERDRQREVQDALFAARNKPSPDAPTDLPVDAIQPVMGPNPDGLTHLATLAHAADADEQALIAQDLANNGTNAQPQE